MNNLNTSTTAAESLEGCVLKGRWQVIKKITNEHSTGGMFSCCYLVSDGEQDAFLKAIDYQSFFHLYDGNFTEALKKMTDTYEFERKLLELCREKRLSKVALIIDEGHERVENFTIPVPFLIFELADGDVRSILSLNSEISVYWKLKSIHNVAVGLSQLNNINVAHQDLKPSNVLIYQENSISKIGDVGRSLCRSIKAPHDDGRIYSGDSQYAPPEVYYGYSDPDWVKKLSTDNYQLGSLIVFYFTYLNFTSLVFDQLEEEFHYYRYKGTYPEVLPYLVDAYYKALDIFSSEIENDYLKSELKQIIKELCHPNPEMRGHPANKGFEKGNPYCLRRYVTKLSVLYKKAYYQVLQH